MPTRRLNDRIRTAFVTGASAGLGQAFADMLLGEGVQVWGTARDPQRLQALARRTGFHPVSLELGDADATESAYRAAHDAAAGFDLVINNAGYGVFAPFAEEDFATWERQVAVMLVQPMRLAQLALRQFRDRDRGTLVNVASLAVEFPLPYMSGYNVVKAGLAALSESLLIETAGTGITVVDFRPGDYRTAFNRSMSQSSSWSPATHGSASLRAIWQTLEANLAAAPDPRQAARDLRRVLVRGQRGVVRSGSFFQAGLAPTFAAYLPQSWRRAMHWHYFNVR